MNIIWFLLTLSGPTLNKRSIMDRVDVFDEAVMLSIIDKFFHNPMNKPGGI